MIEPTEADIGRGVIYRADSKLIGERERGVITSFNDHAVFVRYTNGSTSAATSREDLTWEHGTGVHHNVVDRAAETIGPVGTPVALKRGVTPGPWFYLRSQNIKPEPGGITQWSIGRSIFDIEGKPHMAGFPEGGQDGFTLSLSGYCTEDDAALICAAQDLRAALSALYAATPDNEGGALGEACRAARAALQRCPVTTVGLEDN